jgi:NAD(P)-dependent dehydrogenase (short-subunit alcohol dehydrogenase family)
MKREVFYATLGAAALGIAAWRFTAKDRVQLRNRVVLITGGSRGLGLALAREFGRHGARLAICGRDVATLERARDDLRSRGYEVAAMPCDIRDPDEVAGFVDLVLGHYGAIDVVVNNAGIISVGPQSEMTNEDYEDALRTHFWGPHEIIQATLPCLRVSLTPAIVNISSIGGLVSIPHLLPYCTSKFALLGYSLGLRQELAGSGISVTTVCPGLMRTGSPRNALFKGQAKAEYAWFTLGDSLPFTSISADVAAQHVVDATRRGTPLLILSRQAKTIALLQHWFPRLTVQAFTLAARLLPPPGGDASTARRGHESESPISQSLLTALGRHAELTLNQRDGVG